MKNIIRISGGILLIFFIQSCKKDEPTLAVITTTTVTEVSYTTATSGGDLTDEGGASVVSKGVCWNTSVDPSIANSKTIENGGLGTFKSNITQLTPNTKYYVRAYGMNSAGIGYGNQVSFTTLQVTVPVLTTTAITSITSTTAVSGGNITAENGGSVTEKGVCWSTSANPVATGNRTTDGTGTGSFTSNITGLQPGTTYYLRAYATNSAGTGYGNELNFSALPALATLTTEEITNITQTTASGGGNISNDGGASITARGVCWSTSQNPTTTNSFTTDGSGTGSFTSNLTLLNSGTTYYVRAYATNTAGTAYGNEVSFTTMQYPKIRLKSGNGLNTGAHIYFLALSKNVNYFNLTTAEKFAYSKTNADWYIDGDVIPFTTAYKDFTLETGTYYLLLSASGLVLVTTASIQDGEQTFILSASTYSVTLTLTRPKKSSEAEQLRPEVIEYMIQDHTELLIAK